MCPQVGHGALQALDTSKTASVVKYGTSASSLSQTAQGTVEIYNQIYNTSGGSPAKGGVSALNYTSPYLHTTVLSNLTPGTQYFYQVHSLPANKKTCWKAYATNTS